MNILCVGDVVGEVGCAYLARRLPHIKKQKSVDLVICNGENSAVGNGITPVSARNLFACGVDVITTGNHVFRRREVYPLLEENPRVLRPANFPPAAAGKGYALVDMGFALVAVINLMGNVYMSEDLPSPLDTADALLQKAKEDGAAVTLIDFHAEATAEKRALGFYLDGRVSVVFGTHTHVPTADEQILPGQTGYVTDLGMVGPINSILGVKTEQILDRMRRKMPIRFETAEGDCSLGACLFSIDHKTGRATAVERIPQV